MKRRWLIALGVAGLWWMRGGDEVQPQVRTQVGVLPEGWVVMRDNRIVELDRGGATAHEMTLGVPHDVRLVGTRSGTAVGWQDGHKVKLAVLDGSGEPHKTSTWGKKVVRLCDGAASNEHRFAVGWLEGDGGVWFVHGPIGGRMDALTVAPKVTWCGIASAEQNIALLWRESSKLMMGFCTSKACSGLVTRIPIDDKDTLLGYGCVRESCLFATRDKQGTTKLHRVNQGGRAIVKVLDGVRSDSAVHVIGAGNRAFAVAFVATDGNATIRRVTTELAIAKVDSYAASHAPQLAWAAERLLVADPSRSPYVITMPR